MGFFIDVIAKPCFKELEAVARSEEGREMIAEEVLKQCEANKQNWQSHYGNGEFDAQTFKIEDIVEVSKVSPKMPYRWREDDPLPKIGTEQLLREITAFRVLGSLPSSAG